MIISAANIRKLTGYIDNEPYQMFNPDSIGVWTSSDNGCIYELPNGYTAGMA